VTWFSHGWQVVLVAFSGSVQEGAEQASRTWGSPVSPVLSPIPEQITSVSEFHC
jgi:hypothetical protein